MPSVGSDGEKCRREEVARYGPWRILPGCHKKRSVCESMGLDVAAFRKLRPIDRDLTQYGARVDGQPNWKPITAWTSFTKAEIEFTDRYWPGGSEGIRPGQIYTFAESRTFRAYGGYAPWRSLLDEFASANFEGPRTARRAFGELRLPGAGAVRGKFALRYLGTWFRRPAILSVLTHL
jgi:hypothetical protein